MSDYVGAQTFQVDGGSYDSFMGRYSVLLGSAFADFAGVRRGQSALDVGCGPGALTGELWAGFLAGVGPAGNYVVTLAETDRRRLRDPFFEVLGSPEVSFSPAAVAIAATGRKVR